MPLSFLDTLSHAGPLFTLAIVILVGMGAGSVARRMRLPGITGQIVAGIALGRSGLDLFGDEALHALQPLTQFALGLMAVTVGAHLNLRRLRNAGKRLFALFVLESTITPALVFIGIWGLGRTDPAMAALLATVAIATAPATIVALVSEQRAKGVFVKTLVAAVALNNMACIFLFEVARAVSGSGVTSWTGALLGPGRQLLLAMLLGGVLAVVMERVTRSLVQTDRLATAAVLALVLASGTASFFGVSPLLACLFLGLFQTNLSTTRDKLVDSMFADFQPVILAVFFTLAGMHLSFEHAVTAGFLAVLLFTLRALGKLVAAYIAMRYAKAPRHVRQNLGLALMPQAGVAVALVIFIQDDPQFAHLAEIFSAVVLTVVTANEILGPIFVRIALRRAGETGMDRVRLMDFLQEENIQTDFQAQTKEEAIEALVDLMISSHHLNVDRDALLSSVLAREGQASTCLGGGLAVPHGILPEGHGMAGVMGIARAGLAFDTPDKRPVHCMVLLGTSQDERDRHLQVLASLARTIGGDRPFQAQLFNAKSPAHASVLMHGEDSHDFNYFLESES